LLKALDNREQFLVINWVVKLCRGHGLGEVAYRLLDVAGVFLGQYTCNHPV
jgi:hypothetical protein